MSIGLRSGRARGVRKQDSRRGGQRVKASSSVLGHAEERDPEEHDQRHAQAVLSLVDLGDEVAGRDVQGHARREGQRVATPRPRSGSCPARRPWSPRPGRRTRSARRACPCPEASAMEATVTPSGILCRTTAKKMRRPRGTGDEEAGRDRDAVEEGVDGEADQGGDADGRVHHHLVVALLAEVEVRGHGVLEELDEEVAGQDQHRRVRRRARSTRGACAGTSRPA